jgi:hypothetical protein
VLLCLHYSYNIQRILQAILQSSTACSIVAVLQQNYIVTPSVQYCNNTVTILKQFVFLSRCTVGLGSHFPSVHGLKQLALIKPSFGVLVATVNAGDEGS